MAKTPSFPLELVSFATCPFVHRTAMLLREKDLEYSIRYIDLANKPDWFLALSPRGRVPILNTRGTTLFESAVINEYIDETEPPRLLPADALERARQRAWIEVASDLFMAQFQMLTAPDDASYEKAHANIAAIFDRLDTTIADDYFAGPAIGLVDIAFAPALFRFALIEKRLGKTLFADRARPKLAAWTERLLARPSLTEAVIPEFNERFFSDYTKRGGWLARSLAT